MSLAIKYETMDDARLRLRSSVVLYRGAPVYIKDVVHGDGKAGDIFRVLFDELPLTGPGYDAPKKIRVGALAQAAAMLEEKAEDVKRKFISSKHFDIAPFSLGYVNCEKGAFFCSRMPGRVQKQGLCVENFKALTNGGTPVDFGTFLKAKGVVDMVAGNYPTFEEAIRSLDKATSVAFNRNYCVMRDEVIPGLIFLYHKGTKVGMYTAETDRVKLGTKFNCLKESLEEMKLKVGVI